MIQESIYNKKLKCGLDVYLILKKGFKKKFAIYATQYGSIDSEFVVPGEDIPTEVPDGIAHFLEHKLFAKSYGNVFDKFAEFGASANAYTSYTHTAYLFSCTDNFEENLELLLDFVQEPYFIEENIEKEKGIIEQELKMYRDDPNWRVLLNLLKAVYEVHPVRKDIGGTVESIKLIDADILYRCYNTFYHPENMVLLVIGDFEPDEVLNQIEKNYEQREYKPQGDIRRIYPKEPDTVNESKIEEKLSVSEPLCFMAFKDRNVGFSGEKLFRKDITTSVLLDMAFGRGSNLYKDLYEDGLIDNRFRVDYDGRKNYGHCILGGPTQDPYVLHNRIIEGMEKTKDSLDEEIFARIKKKKMGNYVRNLNSPEFLSSIFISYFFYGINVFRYLDILEKTSFSNVLNRFDELIDPRFHSYSIIMPK